MLAVGVRAQTTSTGDREFRNLNSRRGSLIIEEWYGFKFWWLYLVNAFLYRQVERRISSDGTTILERKIPQIWEWKIVL